jgi:hypothetical protein
MSSGSAPKIHLLYGVLVYASMIFSRSNLGSSMLVITACQLCASCLSGPLTLSSVPCLVGHQLLCVRLLGLIHQV